MGKHAPEEQSDGSEIPAHRVSRISWGSEVVIDYGPTHIFCEPCGGFIVDAETESPCPFYSCKNCRNQGRELLMCSICYDDGVFATGPRVSAYGNSEVPCGTWTGSTWTSNSSSQVPAHFDLRFRADNVVTGSCTGGGSIEGSFSNSADAGGAAAGHRNRTYAYKVTWKETTPSGHVEVNAEVKGTGPSAQLEGTWNRFQFRVWQEAGSLKLTTTTRPGLFAR